MYKKNKLATQIKTQIFYHLPVSNNQDWKELTQTF